MLVRVILRSVLSKQDKGIKPMITARATLDAKFLVDNAHDLDEVNVHETAELLTNQGINALFGDWDAFSERCCMSNTRSFFELSAISYRGNDYLVLRETHYEDFSYTENTTALPVCDYCHVYVTWEDAFSGMLSKFEAVNSLAFATNWQA